MSDQHLDEKTCPLCAEVIKLDAIKCKHCGSMLNQPIQRHLPVTSSTSPSQIPPQSAGNARQPEAPTDSSVRHGKTPMPTRDKIAIFVMVLVVTGCLFAANQTATTTKSDKRTTATTTINRIVSRSGSSGYELNGKRVVVEVTFHSVNRKRKELRAQDCGEGVEGSYIAVCYEGTHMDDYFADNDPTGYLVTGALQSYSNSNDLYIQAEKIERL